jgi:hypothetical protein
MRHPDVHVSTELVIYVFISLRIIAATLTGPLKVVSRPALSTQVIWDHG